MSEGGYCQTTSPERLTMDEPVTRHESLLMSGQNPCTYQHGTPNNYMADVKALKYNKVDTGAALPYASARWLSERVCPTNSHQLAASNYTRQEPSTGCNALLATTNSDMLLRGTSFGAFEPIGTSYGIEPYNGNPQEYYKISGTQSSPAVIFSTAVTQKIYLRDLRRHYDLTCMPY